MTNEERFMKEALRMAQRAKDKDEVPIGCVIVKDGKVIARGWNERETKQLSSAHAEMRAIEKACKKIGSWRLEDCDLYVTLEPCPMCAGAIIQSRIRNVYYGAADPKGGSVDSLVQLFKIQNYNHHPEATGGILEDECSRLLKDFFKEKRIKKKAEKENRKRQDPINLTDTYNDEGRSS